MSSSRSGFVPGRIPDIIGELSSLQVLHLTRNMLKVRMIDKVKRLLRLLSLRVTAIAFLCWRAPTGAIPDTIGQLQELQDLRVHNLLAVAAAAAFAAIGVQFSQLQCNFTMLETHGKLKHNTVITRTMHQLAGTIPVELGACQELELLSLAGNKLQGCIPHDIQYLESLESLDVFGNNLTGAIPPTLSKLVELEDVRFNDNKLTGTVPDFSAALRLNCIDLSSNKLEGELVINRKLSTVLPTHSHISLLAVTHTSHTMTPPHIRWMLGRLVLSAL
eukprot:7935-Heterococcus_DN1.PRE.1